MKKSLFPQIFLQLTVVVLLFNVIQGCKKDHDEPDNQPPVVDARTSREVVITTDTITLIGSASDADGTITAYLWSQISGPNHATIINPGSSSTVVNGFVEGTYLFQLMVTDDKGDTGVDTVSVKVSQPPCTEKGSWIGVYAEGNGPFEVDTVNDANFIKNGIAQLANSPWSYFFCDVQLSLPACRIIDADTVRLEVSLKNPSTGVNAITDYDVGLQFEGSTDTAIAVYIGYRPQFTKFGLNQKNITNSANLLYVFEDWTTVTLEANNNVLTTKRNGTVTESLSYNGYSIGLLKKINISFKGSGSIDWIKLYSSKSNTLLMQEDFNEDGKSSVAWY